MNKIILTILTFFTLIGILNAEEVLFSDFSKPSKYTYTIGGEFPGTIADFKWDENGYKSKGCLAINYNFNEKGMYCQWKMEYPISESETGFSFMAKNAKDSNILIRIIDRSGEVFQNRYTALTSDWDKYTVNFKEQENKDHWAGNNNGKIDYPINTIYIGPERSSMASGILYIDNLYFISNSPDKFISKIIDISLKTNKTGNLFYPNDSLKGKIIIENTEDKNKIYTLNLIFKDGFGKEIKSNIKNIRLSESTPRYIDLPNIKGICEIEYTLKIGENTKTGVLSYAVIKPQKSMGKDSYFGVNTHFNVGWDEYLGAVTKRAGIEWIRDGEASLDDMAINIAKKYNLNYMPCFTNYMQEKSVEYIKSEMAKGKKYNDKWNFTGYIENFGEYAKKYGNDIDIYDLLNEPCNLGWPSIIPDTGIYETGFHGGKWLGVFYQWGTQVSNLIKKNDANSKAALLWEDNDRFEWAKEYINYGVNKEVDYISPHPYTIYRNEPLPERQVILPLYSGFEKRKKETNRNWDIIIGEAGFSSFTLTKDTPNEYYPPYNRTMQAANLVRMMVIHLNFGVKRIFWYDLKNDGTNPSWQENNFGLVWPDGTPKPAIVSYSNLINLCDGAKWLGEKEISNSIKVYGFQRTNGEYGLVLWSIKSNEANYNLKINKTKQIKIYNLFGEETSLITNGQDVNLKLSEHPIFVTGLEKSDI